MNKAQPQDQLQTASIEWREEEPYSPVFEDVYFSKHDGLGESKYVFFDSNNISDRLHRDDSPNQNSRPFVIAETGFGTGLNFLLTWKLWDETDTPNKPPLHFISIEKFPLRPEDLIKVYNAWPELMPYALKLVDNYPLLVKGLHYIELVRGKVSLSLIIGDVNEGFTNYNFSVDAWYLDGFAPSKNPEMWSPTLFKCIQQYSKPGTTFATFTAASLVRKSLQAIGFNVQKQKGFGRKREMAIGVFEDINERPAHLSDLWSYQAPNNSSHEQQANTDYDVIIVGAGLAGISTAKALSGRNLRVAVFEAGNNAMTGASKQSQLAMYAKLPAERNKLFNFIEHCLGFSIRYYENIQRDLNEAQFWHKSGLIQLDWSEKDKQRSAKLQNIKDLPTAILSYQDKQQVSALSGISLKNGGFYFPKAGWLNPHTYGNVIQDVCNDVSFRFNTTIEHLERRGNAWLVHTADSSYTAANVVICNATDALKFKQVSHLPVKPLRGQVTTIRSNVLQPVKTIICGEGYLCPPVNDDFHIGATFDLEHDHENVLERDNEKNIHSIKNWLPEWNIDVPIDSIAGSAGLRCTTPDYLPIVGLAADYSVMLDKFANLRVDATSCDSLYGEYLNGLYLNIGHGSKGVFSTPLAANLIASMIVKQPLPVNETIRKMMSPARFIVKHLKQKRI